MYNCKSVVILIMYTVLPRFMVFRELYMTEGVKRVLMYAKQLLISLDKLQTNVKALDSLDPKNI